MFYDHVKKMFSTNTTLNYMEKCALMESLVLISNQFKDFAKQKAFVDELTESVVADWTSEELSLCVTFLLRFLNFFMLKCSWCNCFVSYCNIFSLCAFSVLSNPAMFLSFVGADQVVTEQNTEPDTMSFNRGRVSRVFQKHFPLDHHGTLHDCPYNR